MKHSRRDWLKLSFLTSLAGYFFFQFPGKLFAKEKDKSEVILIRDKEVLKYDGNPDKSILSDMMDKAITTLTGINNSSDAWKSIIKPDDIVGIKSNEWSHLPTPEALEEILKERVLNAGVREQNISVRDRGILKDPVFQKSTALINVRPMRTHDWSGAGTLIKNYIVFTKKPWTYHPDTCADLAKLWKLPEVAGKTRLNILVMLTPLFHGTGPHHFNKEYIWNYYGLLVGFDSVAVDSVGVRILENKRKEYFCEERPLNPPAKHILLADTRHKLGNANPEKIKLVTIGWKEGILL
ncbi:MAG: DUF362 domain-containing protein [Bacteroidales bacterium]|nr:DUF362 domain-containing protein [Bacteroidales bacterium]